MTKQEVEAIPPTKWCDCAGTIKASAGALALSGAYLSLLTAGLRFLNNKVLRNCWERVKKKGRLKPPFPTRVQKHSPAATTIDFLLSQTSDNCGHGA